MSRARFYRPAQDSLGNIIAGGSVRLYDAVSGSPFAGNAWADAAGTTLRTEPWIAPNGIIDFYLDQPQFITIGYTPVGGTEMMFPFQAVYAPGFYVFSPTFTNPGGLVPFTGTLPIYVKDDMFIEQIFASVGVSPVGSAIVVDVKVNGVSIFSSPASMPRINPGDTTATAFPDNPVILGNQRFTMDVVDVGSTTPGSDLVVQIWARQQAPDGVL
jgi:hypothetical protein